MARHYASELAAPSSSTVIDLPPPAQAAALRLATRQRSGGCCQPKEVTRLGLEARLNVVAELDITCCSSTEGHAAWERCEVQKEAEAAAARVQARLRCRSC